MQIEKVFESIGSAVKLIVTTTTLSQPIEETKVSLNIEEKNGFMNFETPSVEVVEIEARFQRLERAVFGAVSANKEQSVSEIDLPSVPLDEFDF